MGRAKQGGIELQSKVALEGLSTAQGVCMSNPTGPSELSESSSGQKVEGLIPWHQCAIGQGGPLKHELLPVTHE